MYISWQGYQVVFGDWSGLGSSMIVKETGLPALSGFQYFPYVSAIGQTTSDQQAPNQPIGCSPVKAYDLILEANERIDICSFCDTLQGMTLYGLAQYTGFERDTNNFDKFFEIVGQQTGRAPSVLGQSFPSRSDQKGTR